MPHFDGLARKPSSASAALGFLVSGLAACASGACSGSRDLTHAQLVKLVRERDCPASRAEEIPLLIAALRPGDTTYVASGDASVARLTPATPIQIGGLTTAFVTIPEDGRQSHVPPRVHRPA